MVNVALNGSGCSLPEGTTVDRLLQLLDRGPKGVAVAVNEELVPSSQWAVTALREHDRVEILTAAQGG